MGHAIPESPRPMTNADRKKVRQLQQDLYDKALEAGKFQDRAIRGAYNGMPVWRRIVAAIRLMFGKM